MAVTVKLFAGLRERAGFAESTVDAATVADVWPALGLGDEPEGVLYAVNNRYADRDTALAEGDEVALIPPVSGGAFRLTEEPIDPAAVVREVSDPRAGGIATFIGTTRVQSRGRTVHYLDYEAYGGMAEEVMAKIADELKRKHDLCEVAITHRVGRVDIGELSVVIAVSAPHRAAALAACKEAIDTLKQTVPLWKKEVYEGGEEWIGQGS
jgi:molybdopterin synthase catalytic subunit/molybdopterin converting factor small subunit